MLAGGSVSPFKRAVEHNLKYFVSFLNVSYFPTQRGSATAAFQIMGIKIENIFNFD